MNHKKTFEAINKLKEIEIELHRLKNALEMTNRALETKDEPVAWMNRHGACKTSLFMEVEAGAKEEYTIPVYTQPQREWVGLTDEEIWGTISRIGTSDSDVNPYTKLADARAIEAKLKQKNT